MFPSKAVGTPQTAVCFLSVLFLSENVTDVYMTNQLIYNVIHVYMMLTH